MTKENPALCPSSAESHLLPQSPSTLMHPNPILLSDWMLMDNAMIRGTDASEKSVMWEMPLKANPLMPSLKK